MQSGQTEELTWVDSVWVPGGAALLCVVCVVLAYLLGAMGALSFVALVPYGYFWWTRVDRRRRLVRYNFH
jgi:hypothetical protein